MKTVVIDPGHYGKYNQGVSGSYYESVFVLKLSKLIRDKLSGKVNVILTRENENDLSLTRRGQIAVENNAFMFISEHTNAGSPTAKGCEVFYSVDIPSDKVYADKMSSMVAEALNTTNRGGKVNESTTYKGEDYYTVIDVAQDGNVPHVFLIENAFHSNIEDESKLKDDTYLNKIADAQVKIICEICGVAINTPIENIIKGEVNMSKEEILKVQKLLNRFGILGADGKALTEDGLCGPNTKKAMAEAKAILNNILK